MLNIIDLVVAGLILFYLLKNAGGIIKTVKNVLIVLAILLLFGLASRLLLNSPFISGDARKTLENAYFVRLSHALIAWGYPAVENSAPKINSFVKEQIIAAPTAETKTIKIPKIKVPEKELERLLEAVPVPAKKR
ncbi:hypothetical protein A2625_03875 [candidate division WOR-1 bacterium RIFCSPHIGHO2_01_FULL_53_15]|uniref:Uncharacterized protein n=1 Tax=candidate division WOR-1 bacterium RIFCSPHIGHO2_01_FULL_53_15 TaxID=1802564 RepID=A0A1F4Q075_UNCSA|nr:MAG: hypothetical protein A2625_03875 [candidate division WOR-1 bacterium RIFCSPHIGHO2_01_FULL_53_15]OGC12909.1 MAG: hypothetical protein A3D23_04910 [candidate division WOR-1 bacterium RIFCSPHIGHO2_02_FULL_53_26]